jgi:type VII secretion protein EccB
MASKRDQLQAHQFLVQRVISALVSRETDPEQPPFRRPSTAAFASVALAVIALIAVGVYGLVVPGGKKSWQDGKAVIVEKETGTQYVYLGGRLHPVMNYASALLALGDHGETVSVSRNSLADVPRGPRIGIPDAPDSLPGKDRMLTGAWSLCSAPAPDPTGTTVDRSILMVGEEPGGGRPLGDTALLVEVPETGEQSLIWRGYRHRIRQPDTVTVGLALRSEPRARVDFAMMDVLPAGQPIAPIAVSGAGNPSTAVPGRTDLRAGQLLVSEISGGGRQYYLAETDRLRPISEFQYDIQRAYKPTATAYGGGEPIGIPLGLLGAAEARQDSATAPGPDASPTLRPEFAGATGDDMAICATYDPGSSVPRLSVDPRMPAADPMEATPQRTQLGTPLADQVVVPPGWAALIEVMSSAGSPAGTPMIVTDQGRGYAMAGPEVLGILGYGDMAPVRLPASLVARLPQGSGLDPHAALSR